jgi:hypothetical protein
MQSWFQDLKRETTLRHIRRVKDNIKVIGKEIGWEGMD